VRIFVLSFFVIAAAGCMGANEIEVQRDPEAPVLAAPESDTAKDSEPAEVGPAFVIPREQVNVLPFQVRLAKVARVAGVPVTDPILQNLRVARLELGDGDYANGIRPDRSWTAGKLAAWIKALRPVCQSSQLKARFTLPQDLPAMIMTAHGRWADPTDEQLINEELVGETLTDDEKHELVCLTVLASTEFVSR
jgi:hypothetical protein